MYTTLVRRINARRNIIVFFVITALLIGAVLLLITTDAFDQKPIMNTPPENALYLDSTQPIDVRVADLLSYMTLEEKIGQMILIEKNSIHDLRTISDFKMGGLLSGSGAKPEVNSIAGWKQMITHYQKQTEETRLAIPLLYGSDAIHGHAHVPGATVFPHAIGLGATNDPELVERIAEATARELTATGVNWNFAPNLDQPEDIRWGRVYESFSDDPARVSTLGIAYLKGLQEGDAPVLATAKHFVGLGSMEWESSFNKNFKIDQGKVPADETLLRAQYLPPYQDAIDAGALSIMVGLNAWGEKKMVLQKELLTDVLKKELGFKGFLVSDWYGVHEGRKNIFWATVSSVNAGVDMLMLPFDYQTFMWHMKVANRLGLVSDERINDAVGRILYAKFALGLFDTAEVEGEIGSARHAALAREAVAKSLVLLKNEGVVPIDPATPYIKVAGSAADNVGRQMGAWSVEWQGIDGKTPAKGVSILEGIESVVSDATVVEYDREGLFDSNRRAAIGIAVVGEGPYAEGWGDNANPTLSEEDKLAIRNLQAQCDTVVVIIVSGRPLILNDIETYDALIAAWLPGGEGGGVADVLFGTKPFTATLPLPWPASLSQLPISHDGTTADGTKALFPRGFGIIK